MEDDLTLDVMRQRMETLKKDIADGVHELNHKVVKNRDWEEIRIPDYNCTAIDFQRELNEQRVKAMMVEEMTRQLNESSLDWLNRIHQGPVGAGHSQNQYNQRYYGGTTSVPSNHTSVPSNHTRVFSTGQNVGISIEALKHNFEMYELALEMISDLDRLSSAEYEKKYGKDADCDPYVIAHKVRHPGDE